jgi:hypothetical protein
MGLFGEMLKMREEKVTINLLKWLEVQGWQIVCYDFPQSGTGVLLHPNTQEPRTGKNKNAIIPDILATKGEVALYFENKDRFFQPDFEKLKEIKTSSKYSDALTLKLAPIASDQVYYGIGIPSAQKHIQKSLEHIVGLDFLVSTCEQGQIQIHFDAAGLFGT